MRKYTHRPVISVLGTTLLSTSPILAYYGPSFLPDAPAFFMILMMGASLLKAGQKQSRGWLVVAGIFAAWAMMLKISMAIVPLAFVISWAIGHWQQKWSAFSLWYSRWPLAVAVAVFCAVLGCRWWIAQYNTLHHAYYFFADIRPIWRYDWPAIREILRGVCFLGLPAYASAGLYLAISGSLWFWLKHLKSAAFFWKKSIFFITLGSLAYILLWFRMLREHDYYVICLMVLPAMLLLAGIRLALLQHAEKTILSALAFCSLLGWSHSCFILDKRLQEAFYPLSTRNLPPSAFLSAAQLSNAGIPDTARFLCPEDPSPNIALLALQRHGWSAYNFGDRITADTLQKYSAQYGLSHLALRDTMVYGALYREFFPFQALETNGWHVYRRCWPVVGRSSFVVLQIVITPSKSSPIAYSVTSPDSRSFPVLQK